MAIIHYVVCIRNVWKIGSTLNYVNILQPVFLHGNFLQCCYYNNYIPKARYLRHGSHSKSKSK